MSRSTKKQNKRKGGVPILLIAETKTGEDKY